MTAEMLVALPATRAVLRALVEEGSVAVADGWAATAALRALDPSMDDEDWEYHATQSAAHAADEDGRAIVVVARVPGQELRALDVPEPGRVRLTADLERDRVEAVFVGTFDAREDAYDLAWYARQEIPGLLR